MAKIGLSEGFSLIPEGTHVFQIVDVKYKETFGKMEVTMQTASGQKHVERFSLLDSSGEANQGGLNAFSYFAKAALNDFTLQEIDHENLLGHFIRCEVTHEEVESNKTPGKYLKFVRLGNKEPADGYDGGVTVKPAAAPKSTPAPAAEKPAAKKKFDLDSLLGG